MQRGPGTWSNDGNGVLKWKFDKNPAMFIGKLSLNDEGSVNYVGGDDAPGGKSNIIGDFCR